MTHLEAILIHQCILCYINCFPLYYLIFLATTCDRTSGRNSSKMHQSIRRIHSLSSAFILISSTEEFISVTIAITGMPFTPSLFSPTLCPLLPELIVSKHTLQILFILLLYIFRSDNPHPRSDTGKPAKKL